MKKIKIARWVIIIGFLALVMFQNKGFFMAKQGFGINLYFTSYEIPEVYNAILFFVFFAAGLLVAYIFSLFSKFKSNKTIKDLKSSMTSSMQQMSVLKQELDALKQASINSGSQNTAQADGSDTIAA
jgi:exosortase/archaeosortase